MISVVIVAAGSSRRMGFDKLSALIGGKMVLEHSIAAFELSSDVAEIILVTRKDSEADLRKLVQVAGFSKVRSFVMGGQERHHSVWNGLQAANPSIPYLAIHDGARPLVTSSMIQICLQAAVQNRAATLAAPVADTLKRADSDQKVVGSVSREGLWGMQTPQIFERNLIFNAYQKVIRSGMLVTDEVSAVQELEGVAVKLISPGDWNFKITYPEDIRLAELVMKLRHSGKPV